MKITLQELAALTGGVIARGEPSRVFDGFASLKEARDRDVSFFGNEKYAKDLATTKAGAVLVRSAEAAAPAAPAASCLVVVENPVTAFDSVLRRHAAPRPVPAPGVHPSASVAPDARLDPDKVSIGANAVIEPGAEIGDGTVIGSCAVIGTGARVGRDCLIGSGAQVLWGCIVGDRVTLHSSAVIGADGFGFEFAGGRHQKIEQLGIVRIEDDVEIGSNTSVDRARFGETVIGEGTKIDNLVQIGHNAVIGKHCIIVAQSGVSGSTRIGDYAILAARVGVGGHLHIGERAVLAARAGVIADVKAGETVFGYPSRPIKDWTRTSMYVKRLGSLFARVRKLEDTLGQTSADAPAGAEK